MPRQSFSSTVSAALDFGYDFTDVLREGGPDLESVAMPQIQTEMSLLQARMDSHRSQYGSASSSTEKQKVAQADLAAVDHAVGTYSQVLHSPLVQSSSIPKPTLVEADKDLSDLSNMAAASRTRLQSSAVREPPKPNENAYSTAERTSQEKSNMNAPAESQSPTEVAEIAEAAKREAVAAQDHIAQGIIDPSVKPQTSPAVANSAAPQAAKVASASPSPATIQLVSSPATSSTLAFQGPDPNIKAAADKLAFENRAKATAAAAAARPKITQEDAADSKEKKEKTDEKNKGKEGPENKGDGLSWEGVGRMLAGVGASSLIGVTKERAQHAAELGQRAVEFGSSVKSTVNKLVNWGKQDINLSAATPQGAVATGAKATSQLLQTQTTPTATVAKTPTPYNSKPNHNQPQGQQITSLANNMQFFKQDGAAVQAAVKQAADQGRPVVVVYDRERRTREENERIGLKALADQRKMEADRKKQQDQNVQPARGPGMTRSAGGP